MNGIAMNTVADFIEFIKKYDLPAELFRFQENTTLPPGEHVYIYTPTCVTLRLFKGELHYEECGGCEVKAYEQFVPDEFFGPLAREEKIRKENEALKSEIEKIREELAKK